MTISGCIGAPSGPSTDPGPLSSLSVYEYRYDGDDVAAAGVAHGWMARVTNTARSPVVFSVEALHANETQWGPATDEGWQTSGDLRIDRLPPGGSRLYLFQATFSAAPSTTGFEVSVLDLDWELGDDPPQTAPVLESETFERSVDLRADLETVEAGHHVQTATVGVWLNGTSFYTNIAQLNASSEFPAGYDNTTFNGDPLPVYVYDEDPSERPPGSRDECLLLTISGYNDLLKTQVDQGTNVRWLAPEEAYTREGAEDHHLYGEVLVFMNTIVAHEDPWPASEAPSPTGDCFDEEEYVPDLPSPF